MSRSKVKPFKQPDEITCGPATLKIALEILGKRKSLNNLVKLCKTSRDGTKTQDMITAIGKLGLAALFLEKATRKHITSIFNRYRFNKLVPIVSYQYATDDHNVPREDSGHWAAISHISPSLNRIVLFDSFTGKRKSYTWHDFKRRWFDYDRKRRKLAKCGSGYKLIKKWQDKPLIIIGRNQTDLPKFSLSKCRVYPSSLALN